MIKRRSFIFTAIFFVIIIVVGHIYYKFSMMPKEPVSTCPGFMQSIGDMDIDGFALIEYDFGNKRMELKTEKASIRQKRIGFLKTPLMKVGHLVKPDIQFFAKGRMISRITATSGKMNMANKKITLNGDVRVGTATGKVLTAQHATLNPSNGQLSVKGRFILNKDGKMTKGVGLNTDVELKKD